MVSSLKSTEEQVIRRKYHLHLSQSQRSDERVSKNSKSTGLWSDPSSVLCPIPRRNKVDRRE